MLHEVVLLPPGYNVERYDDDEWGQWFKIDGPVLYEGTLVPPPNAEDVRAYLLSWDRNAEAVDQVIAHCAFNGLVLQ